MAFRGMALDGVPLCAEVSRINVVFPYRMYSALNCVEFVVRKHPINPYCRYSCSIHGFDRHYSYFALCRVRKKGSEDSTLPMLDVPSSLPYVCNFSIAKGSIFATFIPQSLYDALATLHLSDLGEDISTS